MAMSTFSLRAEFRGDTEAFVKAARAAGFTIEEDIVTPLKYTRRGIERCEEGEEATVPDVYFQFDSSGDLEQMRTVMRTVQDSHIMIETMRQCPLKDNDLSRDGSVPW